MEEQVRPRDDTCDVTLDPPPWYKSTRYFTAFIAFFGMANTFFQRTDLSMAIVCMINHTAVDMVARDKLGDTGNLTYDYGDSTQNTTSNMTFLLFGNNESELESCNSPALIRSGEQNEDGELIWTKEVQGLVLGGLYWGYAGLQICGGMAVRRFGAKNTVTVGMVAISTLSILTPISANWSPWFLIALRAVMGFFCGFNIAGFYGLWSKWAPPNERGRLISFTFCGQTIANAFSFPLSAFLCKYGFAGGWPSIFYLCGILGLCWTLIWLYTVYDEPSLHPRVHPSERAYIEKHLGKTTRCDITVPIPWCKVMTSVPFLSTMCAHVTSNCGLFLMMINLPIYLMEVLHFDIKANGFFSFLPFMAMFVGMTSASIVSDMLITKNVMKVVYVRKLATIVGHLIPAILLAILSQLDCTQSGGAVAILTLFVGLNGVALSGFVLNYYDIAPIFATQIMTLANSLGTSPGVIMPYVVAELTKQKTREQWQTVFLLTSGLLAGGALVYLLFGQGHVQKWAIVKETAEEIEVLPVSPFIDNTSQK